LNNIAQIVVLIKQIIINKKDTDSDDTYTDAEDVKSNKKIKIKKDKKNKKEIEIDNSYLRLPINDIIFTIKDDDNKNKTDKKYNIITMIDKAHQILYNEENIVERI
jgi:hypothetical protein